MTWFAKARCSTSAPRMPGLVDRAGEHACALAGVVGLHRVADRIQLDRANRRAGTDPDGQGAEPRLACVVATGSLRADRQVPRPRVVRTGPYEQRRNEAAPAGATTDRPHRRGRQDYVR